MSNIFNSISNYFSVRESNYYPGANEDKQLDTRKGLIMLGYSMVHFDPKSESRPNNYENL